jgi:hypothetical protein
MIIDSTDPMRKNMARNFTVLISELPDDRRKQAEQRIRLAASRLPQLITRMQGYATGEEPANKLLWDINVIHVALEDVRVHLISDHNLPSDLHDAPYGPDEPLP